MGPKKESEKKKKQTGAVVSTDIVPDSARIWPEGGEYPKDRATHDAENERAGYTVVRTAIRPVRRKKSEQPK